MKSIFVAFSMILLFVSSLNAQWTDLQAAEFVIGQPDMAGFYSARTATGLAGPYCVAIDFQHSKIYVGEADNHRVLRYAYPITANQPTAELVFGQSDFTSNPAQDYFNLTGSWPDPTSRQILYPMALAVYNGDLWVLDHNNQRVVRFAHAYNLTVNNPDADLVIGQANFTTRNFSCTSSSFTAPWGLTIDGSGNLWVADAGNGRVLRFNDVSSLTSGASANGVLGQTSFNTGTLSTMPTQYQFGIPSSLFVDGTTLWVCDREFSRVLRFNNAVTKADGANADGVLGQSDYSTKALGITPSTFNRPFGVCVDGKGNLYVSDQNNKRILIFLNAANKSDGANADNVLGQASFYTISYQYGNNSFAPGSVSNMAVDNSRGKLFVADLVASRVLQFAASNILTGMEPKLSETPSQFGLSAYPNPFISATSFSFTLSSESFVSLVVFDGTGRQLTEVVSGVWPAGTHEVQWKGDGLSEGVYFYRFKVGKYIETKKLILSKYN